MAWRSTAKTSLLIPPSLPYNILTLNLDLLAGLNAARVGTDTVSADDGKRYARFRGRTGGQTASERWF